MAGADLLIAITNRSAAGAFAAWFQAQGISLVLTVLGRGTASAEILDYLGLGETEKAVLLCLASHSPRLLRRAERELWLDAPGRGILLASPVSSIGGAAARDYLLQQEGEETMEHSWEHELVLAITNQGYADTVMEAARRAGATGGTVLHAKGTGMELAKKFFGVSIAAERELVLILCAAGDRKPIMKENLACAGAQTAAQSLVFSLPVSAAAGLSQPETGV